MYGAQTFSGSRSKMMREWDSDLDDTLVIGDFLYDLQMGRNAGTATIHVDPSSEFEWPEMADIQCSSLKELQSFFLFEKN